MDDCKIAKLLELEGKVQCPAAATYLRRGRDTGAERQAGAVL